MENNLEELIGILNNKNIQYTIEEPLKNWCTFKIGGNAKLFVEPKNAQEISVIIKYLNLNKIKFMVLGKGSNILFSDNTFDGVIVHIGKNMSDIIRIDENTIFAQSGARLIDMCVFALENELSGMEELYGIPGSVGGAVFMNAGAYGGEIKNIADYAQHVTNSGEIGEFTAEQLDLSYRHSVYSDNGYIITGLAVKLKKGEYQEIKAKMDDYMNRRVTKQPIELPSAGSTFKRPEGYYASALIDECGLKGHKSGGAMVSDKHAGFVVNKSNASYSDVMSVINDVKKEVLRQKNVVLECEIIIVD